MATTAEALHAANIAIAVYSENAWAFLEFIEMGLWTFLHAPVTRHGQLASNIIECLNGELSVFRDLYGVFQLAAVQNWNNQKRRKIYLEAAYRLSVGRTFIQCTEDAIETTMRLARCLTAVPRDINGTVYQVDSETVQSLTTLSAPRSLSSTGLTGLWGDVSLCVYLYLSLTLSVSLSLSLFLSFSLSLSLSLSAWAYSDGSISEGGLNVHKCCQTRSDGSNNDIK